MAGFSKHCFTSLFMQAIAVITTHRTDDASKLPSLLPTAAPAETEKQEGPQRPKLRLQNIPLLAAQPQKESAKPSIEAEEEWEEVVTVRSSSLAVAHCRRQRSLW